MPPPGRPRRKQGRGVTRARSGKCPSLSAWSRGPPGRSGGMYLARGPARDRAPAHRPATVPVGDSPQPRPVPTARLQCQPARSAGSPGIRPARRRSAAHRQRPRQCGLCPAAQQPRGSSARNASRRGAGRLTRLRQPQRHRPVTGVVGEHDEVPAVHGTAVRRPSSPGISKHDTDNRHDGPLGAARQRIGPHSLVSGDHATGYPRPADRGNRPLRAAEPSRSRAGDAAPRGSLRGAASVICCGVCYGVT